MKDIHKTGQLRNERKFIFNSSPLIIQKFLIFMGAYETYPKRIINSIYFDTVFHKNYTEAVEGIMSRNKIRIRWYGETFDTIIKPQFENKYKINNQNNKIVKKCKNFEVGKKFKLINFEKYLEIMKKNDKEFYYYLNNKYPNLLVTYNRLYYEFQNIRITIDSNLKFIDLTKNNCFTSKNFSNMNKKQVVEFKFFKEYEGQILKFTKNLQNRLSKFSKYEIGLNETFY